MSDHNGGGYPGGQDPNQGSPYQQPQPPYQQPQPNYPTQPNYPPQGYQQPGGYYPPQEQQGIYQQPGYEQGYGAPPPPPPAPVRRGRGPLPFVIAVLVIALLGVGGYFGYQAFVKPVVNGVDHAKLLPNSTVMYFSYDATPDKTQADNWAKVMAAFTSQPGVQDKLNQMGVQMNAAPAMLNQFAQSCNQQGGGSGVNGSILSNLTEFFGGNVTIGYLAPSDSELRQLVGQVAQQSQMMMRNSNPPTGPSQAQAGCAVIHLFENHAVALVELDVNPAKVGGLIDKLKTQAGDESKLTKDESYNGSQIYKVNLGSGQEFFVALIGKEAVVTTNKDVTKLVIDAYKDNTKSLSADPQYQAALSKIPTARIATFYASTARLGAMISTVIDEASKSGGTMGTSLNSMKGIYDQLKNINGAALIAMSAQPNGIQIDTASSLADNTLGLDYLAPLMSDRALVKMLPADTWGFAAAADLKGLINAYLSSIDKMPSYYQSLGMGNMSAAKIRQMFKDSTGLDLDEDILSWMGGEFAVYVQSGPSTDTPEQGGFVLNVKDSKDKAQASIKKINDTLAAKGLLTGSTKLTEVQVAGNTVYKLGSEYNGSFSGLYYGIVGDNFYIASTQATIEALASGKGGVADNANYKGALTNAISNNNGVLYVNFQAIREVYEKYMADRVQKSNSGDTYYKDELDRYNRDTKPFLTPFRSLGITSDGDKNNQHVVMFIDIEK